MKTLMHNSQLAAAVLMICAMSVVGIIDNYIAELANEIGLWQFLLFRTLFMLPLIWGMWQLGVGRLKPERIWPVVLRSVLVTFAMLAYFAALAVMPIAQALAGLFTSPIFIVVISALFLITRVGPWRVLAVLIGFAGVLLVLQPDPSDFEWRILLPVAGGFFYALGAIVTKRMCAGEGTLALLAGNMIALGLAGMAGLVGLELFPLESPDGPDGFGTRGWIWPMWHALPWVVLQAVGSLAAVYLIIKAYQLGEPSYVGVFEFSVMVVGPVYAYLVFGQPINALQVIGIGLIMLAGGIIAVRSN